MSKVPRATRWVAKEQQMLEQYVVAERKNGVLDENRRSLAAYSAGDAHVGHATVALDYLGSYAAAQGCVDVLHGETAGYEKIDLCLALRYHQYLALDAAFEADPRPDKQSRLSFAGVGVDWLHATAVGQRRVADRLASILGRSAGGKGVAGAGASESIETLVAHWVTGLDEEVLVRRGFRELGPYRAIADGAPTDAELDALCDEHIARTDDESEHAFALYPGSVIPFELLAAARRFAFDPARSKHPLLAWPIAKVRTVGVLPFTPELDQFLARARGELSLGEILDADSPCFEKRPSPWHSKPDRPWWARFGFR